jgi:hypothetical protein
MKKIKLTGKRGGSALVADEDYGWLSQYKWNHLAIGYAARYADRRMIYMHREIMGFPESEVDHINGNRLDNRCSNLRPATRRFNATNSGKRYPRGKYGRNVTKMTKCRKRPYHVQCWDHCKTVSGGYYATVKEAQIAAAELRKELGYADC